jgi:hypothetical protein
MINIGLIGEDPNDTSSIKNLLDSEYKHKAKFIPLAKNIKGHQLDNPKLKKVLKIEYGEKRCKYVIFIRDLDGFESQKSKVKLRQDWFNDLNKIVDGKGLLLLNIWELEALILSDIKTFNEIYGIDYKFSKNPSLQKDPKELLMQITSKSNKKFKESHCPEIFRQLRSDEIKKKCKKFNDFIVELESKIK